MEEVGEEDGQAAGEEEGPLTLRVAQALLSEGDRLPRGIEPVVTLVAHLRDVVRSAKQVLPAAPLLDHFVPALREIVVDGTHGRGSREIGEMVRG